MATLQSRASVPFRFNGLPLFAISHDEDLWLTGEDIGRALEYSDPRKGIKTLYERNTEELDRYSTVLKLPVTYGDAASTEGDADAEEGPCGVNLRPDGGSVASESTPAASTRMRPVRVFSEEGVMVLTMLSSQPKAGEFRAWAVGVLKAYRHGNLVIANPANRDRLLETCIKEVRFGNEAAIHTLIAHFGYPESIRKPALPAPLRTTEGAPASMLLATAPTLVRWFVTDYLVRLAEQARSGSGPLLDDLRRKRKNFKYWREVSESGAVFALNHTGGDLLTIVQEQASAAGVVDEINASGFNRWLNQIEPELNAQGWTRRLEGASQGRYVYRLVLLKGEG